MINLAETAQDLNDDPAIEAATSVMDIVFSLPDDFVEYSPASESLTITFDQNWLISRNTDELSSLMITLYLISIGNLWNSSEEDRLIIEMSKIDKEFKKQGGIPIYNNMLPSELKKRISLYE